MELMLIRGTHTGTDKWVNNKLNCRRSASQRSKAFAPDNWARTAKGLLPGMTLEQYCNPQDGRDRLECPGRFGLGTRHHIAAPVVEEPKGDCHKGPPRCLASLLTSLKTTVRHASARSRAEMGDSFANRTRKVRSLASRSLRTAPANSRSFNRPAASLLANRSWTSKQEAVIRPTRNCFTRFSHLSGKLAISGVTTSM